MSQKNYMNRMKRAVAAGMAAVMSQVSVMGAVPVFAEEGSTEGAADNKSVSESEEESKVEVQKEETVYVKADASGETSNVIVSNWLKNPDYETELTDRSGLANIKNVKGDETFSQDGDELVWEANGNDIYYQGESTQELPVKVHITYYLDGEEISPEDLAGKSGSVRMHVQYENNAEYEGTAVPFLMLTGMILPGETFSNVTVDGGRVISDGSRQVVVGMGLPGLSESLELQDLENFGDIEIPESFDVTADVENFELAMTMTVATAGNLSNLGLDDIEGFDDLKDALEELQDASMQLVDGTGELVDGVETLKDACEELAEGMATLDEKTGELNDGVQTLNNKKGDLIDGLNTLASGITTLKTGADSLSSGVNAYTAGVGTLKSGVDAYVTGANTLAGGAKTYVAGAGQL
ncbi:MAG: hypothetical protein Q4C59_13120, partial [Lachnospiraceae bacterium]|nr:hypothetical protein [Lachnospiraceae bacterium]